MYLEKKNFFSRFDETGEPFRCCGKGDCVSLSDRVTKLLDPDVLEIMIGLRFRDKTDYSDLKPESFRFCAYRNLFVLTYGRTRAKMERKPLPSCLVLRVRRQYPDPNNHYTGFKVKRMRKKWFFMFQDNMSSEDMFANLSPFSSPQPSGLQRGDSNSSWRPPSQVGYKLYNFMFPSQK
jgi:hypothetical protein